MKQTVLLFLATAALAACSQEPKTTESAETPQSEETTSDTQEAPTEFEANDYTNVSNWLCHPSKPDDACDVDLTTTVVAADGTTTVEQYVAADEPAFDCFYVYPTVSEDPTPNSDMIINDQELSVIEQQFARFGSVCRLYAPLYRQITLTHLREMIVTGEFKAHPTLNYDDMKDAWDTYLETENNGRGVILLGHSQGAGLISHMVTDEIAGSDDMDRIISVMPIGTNIYPGEDGSYALPPCASATDTACMIGYVSFRGDREPPAESRFGKPDDAGGAPLCTNPAALSGGSGDLNAHLARLVLGSSTEKSFADGVELTTPFAAVPGLLSAECRSNDTHTWLAVDINADSEDPRADDIAGDVVVAGRVLEDWGFHLIDMNVAMGNLISIAESQGAAWLAAQ